MNTLNTLLNEFIRRHDPISGHLFPGASNQKLEQFITSCEEQLGTRPPQDYLDFLKVHDGFVAEGVFLYSSSTAATTYKGELAFLQINLIHRDLPWNKDFLYFGDSDMDDYVLDLQNNSYQIRDKQAFDNICGEFNSFYGLLKEMLELAISRM